MGLSICFFVVGVVKSTQKSYLSKSKDVVIKYYVGKSKSYLYE